MIKFDGINKIILSVSPRNKAAVHVYRDKLGFVEKSFAPNEYGCGNGIHVSFDLDVVDPSVASGVGTPVTRGLSYREAHFALELIAETRLLKVLEICEVNPIVDYGGNRTARLAVELVTSALGKRIYQ